MKDGKDLSCPSGRMAKESLVAGFSRAGLEIRRISEDLGSPLITINGHVVCRESFHEKGRLRESSFQKPRPQRNKQG